MKSDEEKLYEWIKEGKTEQAIVELLQTEARENDRISRKDVVSAMMAVLVALLALAAILR